MLAFSPIANRPYCLYTNKNELHLDYGYFELHNLIYVQNIRRNDSNIHLITILIFFRRKVDQK